MWGKINCSHSMIILTLSYFTRTLVGFGSSHFLGFRTPAFASVKSVLVKDLNASTPLLK